MNDRSNRSDTRRIVGRYNHDEDFFLIGAPCWCPACDQAPQPGHSGCDSPRPGLLLAEREGLIRRVLDEGCWKWQLV